MFAYPHLCQLVEVLFHIKKNNFCPEVPVIFMPSMKIMYSSYSIYVCQEKIFVSRKYLSQENQEKISVQKKFSAKKDFTKTKPISEKKYLCQELFVVQEGRVMVSRSRNKIVEPKRTQDTQDSILSAFCSFFGRIHDALICFRDLVSFS